MLVSAAAGSGKTAVLTERVAKLAAEGTDLSRMLIITFTNAAAAEMKQRISEKVPLSVLAKYSISTFNKFAIGVYKSYYHVIGLPPGLAVCDEYKQEILRSEAMDELFEDLFEEGDEAFKLFLTCYCSPKNNDTARGLISSLYTFTQSMPDPEGWLKKLAQEPFDPEDLLVFAASCAAEEAEAAAGLLQEAGKLLDSADGKGVPKLSAKNFIDLSEIQKISALLSSGQTQAAFDAAGSLQFQRMAATKDEKEAYETVKSEVTGLRDKAKDILKACAARVRGLSLQSLAEERALMLPQIRQLCRLTEEFSQRYASKKLKAGLMDFSDAEHFALRILKDPQVCAEYREKYEYIFVDEYQDSNYVQEELIRSISRESNVFLVGDVKQSIYKFRLAEPELFLEKYKLFRTGKDPLSRVIDLNKNFRSKPLIIDLINKVFRRIMTPATVGLEYDKAAELYEGRPYTGELSYRPQLFLVQSRAEEGDAADEEIAAMKADELEALNAARLIKEYHGKPISAKDGDRPLKYSDMAVLLRSVKSRGEVYYQALMQQGIPVYLERGEGYFDTPEIQVLLSLIKICENPGQDVPLLTVMHFPSFGFSAAELAEIRIGGKDAGRSYYSALKHFAENGSGALKDKAEGFLKKLEAWRKKAAALPLADLVWQLMHESGIASFAQALPGGQQRIANLRAMADRAESYESETAGGIAGFVSYIEQIAGSGTVDTGQVKMLTEADDVVRIMTIHKSKGLEFPFVLLAGMGSRLGGQADRLPIRRHRELGAVLKLADPKRGLKAVPSSFKIIDEKLKQEVLAEDIRVLYVAMTRARDILLLSAAVPDPSAVLSGRQLTAFSGRAFMKDFLSMVLPSVPAADMIPVFMDELTGIKSESSSIDIRNGIENGFEIDESKLPISMEELKARLSFSYEPAPETTLKRKYSVSEILELSGAYEKEPAPVYSGDGDVPVQLRKTGGLTAAEKGTAYHCVMEHIPFTREGKDPGSIAAFIEGLRTRHLLTDEEAAAVDPRRIAAFFSSDIGKRAVASSQVFKESPFVMRTQLSGREVLVQGVIDCYFREDGGFVLVDYKSNYADRSDPGASKEKLRQHYLPQLTLYKEALSEITGTKVVQACLYLFSLDDYVDI